MIDIQSIRNEYKLEKKVVDITATEYYNYIQWLEKKLIEENQKFREI